MRTLRAALDLLGAMNESALDKRVFAQLGVEQLPQLVASEFTTLSICHLASGRREVFGLPAGALSEQDRAAFDRHFHEHPLVRYHAYQGGRGTQRISDSLPLEHLAAAPCTTITTGASASTTPSRCRSTYATECW